MCLSLIELHCRSTKIAFLDSHVTVGLTYTRGR
uniref:Uncharacterized protein n=1 Tax=Anguilla anguilla TaxID=7936 RepID=A0A0E9R0F2_ANGAN